MLHLIREASLERVIGSYPDMDEIPDRNIKLMNDMGANRLKEMLEECF